MICLSDYDSWYRLEITDSGCWNAWEHRWHHPSIAHLDPALAAWCSLLQLPTSHHSYLAISPIVHCTFNFIYAYIIFKYLSSNLEVVLFLIQIKIQMLQICHIHQTKQNKTASWSMGSAVWSHVYGGQSSQLPHGYWSPSHIMSAPASIRDVIMARVRTHPGLTMEPSSGSQSQSQHHSDCSHSHWPHHFQRGLLINHAQYSGASPSRWHLICM